MIRRLRILDYAWHQAHSYRLHALPADFTYLLVRPLLWTEAQRPVPSNFVGGIAPEDVRPGDFDIAFLHLDQWCGMRNNLRALPYRIMNQTAQGIPRIVIMHGTPDDDANRRAILRLIGDLSVVCNSMQAVREWYGRERRRDCYDFPQFRTIIHGYDVDEFWTEPLEKRSREVVTVCSGGWLSRAYHAIPLIERLMRDVPLAWYGPRGNREWLQDYYSYRAMLASTLIYFSPSRRAPMPGARTEAMLSGCCVVTVPGNDIEAYIEHGKTGFIARTYEQARDTIGMLLRDPEVAWRVGQAGRARAREAFTQERFVRDWLSALEEIGVEIETEK